MKSNLSYNTLDALNDEFQQRYGIKSLPESITVDSVTYYYKDESDVSFFQLSQNSSLKYLVVYQTRTKDAHTAFGRLILAWGMNRMEVLPLKAQLVASRAQLISQLQHEGEDNQISNVENDHVIGPTLDIIIEGLNQGQPIKAKVDTGASYCSIDAQNIHTVTDPISGEEVVSFEFRDRKYRVPVETFHAIRSADGGVQNRPVVVLSVVINGRTFTEIEFNLNDRTGMEYDVLLGLNLLTKGDFLIDPKLESVTQEDWEEYQKLFADVTPLIETPVDPTEGLNEVVEVIKQYPHLTLNSILGRMKSDAMVTLEQVQY